ncbi:hypothetical protein V1527DRAFT_474392 [Lipomyces starkeyi]
MNAAVQLGVGIFWQAHIRYSLACPSTFSHINPRWRVQPKLTALNITSQNLQPDVLSVLKDPQGALPRQGRPRGTRRLRTSAEITQKDGTRRLRTSAEITQKDADRVEKVRRCGSCHKAGHNSAQVS